MQKIYESCHLSKIQPNPYWFPRECCAEHKAFDRRQAGLFKLEKEGTVMVALCSKTEGEQRGEQRGEQKLCG